MKDVNEVANNILNSQVNRVTKEIDLKGYARVNVLFPHSSNEEWDNIAFAVIKSGLYKLDKIGNGNEYLIIKNDNYELTQSIIKTNDAVQENFKSQKWINCISITSSIISLLFIGVTTYEAVSDTTATELRGLSKEVQSIRQLYQRQEIDSSYRNRPSHEIDDPKSPLGK